MLHNYPLNAMKLAVTRHRRTGFGQQWISHPEQLWSTAQQMTPTLWRPCTDYLDVMLRYNLKQWPTAQIMILIEFYRSFHLLYNNYNK